LAKDLPVTSHQLQQLMPLLFLIPIVAIIIFRNLKPRRLRLELMWIRPVMILVVATAFLVLMPFPHQSYAVPAIVAAAVAGAAVGWLRGRMVRVSVDPETHTATSQASPLGVALIVVIIGVRYFLNTTAGAEGGELTPQAMLLTDALLTFGAGVVSVTGLEVWMRASKMINQSRSAKAQAA
jgi:hypothetical protein